MSNLKPPMIGTLADQKKAKSLCKLCQQDRSYQGWEDSIVYFIHPMETFHLGCLQDRVRLMVTTSIQAMENVETAVQLLTNFNLDIITSQLPHSEELAKSIIALTNALKNLREGLV